MIKIFFKYEKKKIFERNTVYSTVRGLGFESSRRLDVFNSQDQ